MSDWPFSPPLSPMKAVVRDEIPVGDWAYEPKWDGFRMIAWSGPDVRLDSRSGRPLLRYLPELTPALEGFQRDGGRRRDRGGDRRPGQLRRFGEPDPPGSLPGGDAGRGDPCRLGRFRPPRPDGEDLRQHPFSERRRRLEEPRALGWAHRGTSARSPPTPTRRVAGSWNTRRPAATGWSSSGSTSATSRRSGRWSR